MQKGVKVNRRKYPHRGLTTKIARDLGVSPQAVSNALENNNPEIIEIYNRELSKRIKKLESYNETVKKTA